MICDCGSEMEWTECYSLGCDNGFVDEYDDDPINYAPGEEFSKCRVCDGKGGYYVCTTPERHPQPTKDHL